MTIHMAWLPSFGVSHPLSFLADSNFSFFKFFLIKNHLLIYCLFCAHGWVSTATCVPLSARGSSEDSTGQWVLLGQLWTPACLGQELLGGSFVSAARFEVGVQALPIPASTRSFLNGRLRPLISRQQTCPHRAFVCWALSPVPDSNFSNNWEQTG